ncbi:hypothetical protein [Flavobacterium rhizosphaerae]|uniref:Uncharacterized protein n=1 Tax=Flavobacterium rhizosphaerae TaxID=3163298 RepID=A0ABW8YX73_9FLAO
MIATINNIQDVETFFKDLYNEGVSAHPDDDFNDYINYETNEATYTVEEAIVRNELMNRSFIVCENASIDIYELMAQIYLIDLK